MKKHSGKYKAMLRATALSISFIALSQVPQLSLKHGVYVQQSYQCKGAPNAAIMFWDGVGFSGAHSSKCTSTVLRQNGRRFRMSTTCSAMGDGSPDTSGHVNSFTLTRLSSTRFEVLEEKQPEVTWRWCSAHEPE